MSDQLTQVRSHFEEKKFVFLNGFLQDPLLMAAHRYALMKAESGEMSQDEQVPGTPAAYADTLMETLLEISCPTVEHVTGLKLKTQPLGILRLDLGDQGGRVEFSPQTTVDPLAVVKLVQSQPATYRLEGATMLRISRRLTDFAARLTFAEELVDLLAPPNQTDELVANG